MICAFVVINSLPVNYDDSYIYCRTVVDYMFATKEHNWLTKHIANMQSKLCKDTISMLFSYLKSNV